MARGRVLLISGTALVAVAGLAHAQLAPAPTPAPVSPYSTPSPSATPGGGYTVVPGAGTGPAAKPAAPPAVVSPPKPVAPVKPPEPLKRARAPTAILQALDKVTAETLRFEAPVGQPIRYKTLVFTVRACETTAADEIEPDAAAYVVVDSQPKPVPGRALSPSRQVFRGWMYAGSPGLNPLGHPVYDAWLIACKAPAPPPAPVVRRPKSPTVTTPPADGAASPPSATAPAPTAPPAASAPPPSAAPSLPR